MPDLELPSMDETLGAAFDAAEELHDNTNIDDGPASVEAASSEDATAEAPETELEQAPEQAAAPESAPVKPEVSEQPRSNDAIEQVLAPRREALAMQGLDDAQAVRQLFALSDYADRDPQGFVQWFAQQRGLDMTSLVPQQPTEEVDEFADPDVVTLRNELRQIKEHIASQSNAQAQAQAQAAQAQVQAFAGEKDAQGNLLRPHFDAVKAQVAALLRSGVDSLDSAYEQACWSNPRVRSELMKVEEAKRLAAAKAAAEKAAKTADQPRTPGGQFASAKPRTMEETLSEAYDRMH